jgi:hypothetical protein
MGSFSTLVVGFVGAACELVALALFLGVVLLLCGLWVAGV